MESSLRGPPDSGFYVFIWRVIKEIMLPISLSVYSLYSGQQLQKQQLSILLFQSPEIKMTSFPKHTGDSSLVVLRTML